MASIFLGAFLTFSVSSFIKLNRSTFITNNEWSPIYQTYPLDYQAWGNAGVLLKAAKMHFGLPCQRKPLTTL